MRYAADHKQKTRDRVLAEAGRALRQQGPHQIGVAAVMKAAGLTQGGFYAHFSSKDELVASAIEHMFTETAEAWREVTDGRSPQAGLAAYIDVYLSRAHRDARGAGCPLPFLSSDLPRLPAEAQQRFAAGVQRLRRAIAGHLAKIGHADPEAEASSMLAELVGALALARSETDPARADAILERSRTALKRRFGLDS